MASVGLDLGWGGRADCTWANTRLTCVRHIANYWLKSEATSRLLSIENLAVLALLLHLKLLHLAFLLSLHLLTLSSYGCDSRLVLHLNVTLHSLLIDLSIKYRLIRVLHLILVHSLLFDLLSSLGAARLLSHLFSLFDLLLLFLLLQCEIGHVFRIDVCLLVQCRTLMGQIALLVGIPRVVLQLGHRGQITTRLARLKVHATAAHNVTGIFGH